MRTVTFLPFAFFFFPHISLFKSHVEYVVPYGLQ